MMEMTEHEKMQKANNKTTNSITNMESNTSNAPLGKEKTTRFNTPVSIHIHEKRKRLHDADGGSAKAVLDGIVRAGILEDDSAKHIKELTFSQEKTKGEEETIITVDVIKNET